MPQVEWDKLTEAEQARLRRANNPTGKSIGSYTGRCANCESNDLWDDASMYGCNCCGAMYSNLHG